MAIPRNRCRETDVMAKTRQGAPRRRDLMGITSPDNLEAICDDVALSERSCGGCPASDSPPSAVLAASGEHTHHKVETREPLWPYRGRAARNTSGTFDALRSS